MRGIRLVFALALLPSCSYLMMDRPPRAVRRGDVMPACTTKDTYAYVDIGLAAFAVVGAAMIYGGYARAEDRETMTRRELSRDEKIFLGTVALAEAGFFVLSSRHGFDSIARCRKLQGSMPAAALPPGGAP